MNGPLRSPQARRAQPVGLGAGFQDVRVERDPVDDRGDQSRVTEHRPPFAERQIGADADQLVQRQQIQPGVTTHDPGQRAVVGGFDQFR